MSKIVNELLNAIPYTGDLNEDDLRPTPENESGEVALNTSKQGDKNAVWTCSKCFVQIKQKKNIPRHQRICPPVKKVKISIPKLKTKTIFKCELCEAQFSLQKSLTAHAKRNHTEEYCLENRETLFSCSQCNFKSIADKYLKAHVRKFHMPTGNFSCEFCNNKYANKDSLRVHVKSVHLFSKSSYVCEECGCVIVPSSQEDTHTCLVHNQVAQGRHGYQEYAFTTQSQVSAFNNNIQGQDPWQFSRVGASGWQHYQVGTEMPLDHSQAQFGGNWHHSQAQFDGNWQHSQAQFERTGAYSQAQFNRNGPHFQAQFERNWQHSQANTNEYWQHGDGSDGTWQHSLTSDGWTWPQPQARTGGDLQQADVHVDKQQSADIADEGHAQHPQAGTSSNSSPIDRISEVDGRKFVNL